MKVKILAAMVVVATVVAMTEASLVPPYPGRDCKHWCKDNNEALYCCGPPGITYPPLIREHPGKCPSVRSTCTGVRSSRPKLCPHDGACDFRSKCCYDACVEHHVCKTVEFY
uniref:Crustin n=1 Tax=Scylla tranquebarica TaxID=85553 RepID=I1VZH3_9EUCA|nr:crustin [Scylla tranquebarica]UFQ20537.1 crustin protein [Scylla serrata]